MIHRITQQRTRWKGCHGGCFPHTLLGANFSSTYSCFHTTMINDGPYFSLWSLFWLPMISAAIWEQSNFFEDLFSRWGFQRHLTLGSFVDLIHLSVSGGILPKEHMFAKWNCLPRTLDDYDRLSIEMAYSRSVSNEYSYVLMPQVEKAFQRQ